ncbi:hypothetical protein L3Q82_016506 [Scortum barcoo]|uniref:Uncharacterized protein n=1 Tax=Scortum barcoo TaxID=214431 RepID=A0ACB8X8C0_9TELE|nr:hypothetical protein L3Q82_016506 [Scortum barcoo]
MSLRFHLVASLLFCCSGASSVHGPPQQVLAFAGEDVILPCSFNVTARNDFPTVEWSKEGLQPDVIFLYRDGCETYEMKNPDFQYRTSLIVKELKNRNVSLRISSVRLSDEGKYKCMKLWKDAPREITTVTLVVVAVSEPKLSVVSAESGGVTLQCEANCWLPKPEISLLDDQGNIIPAEEPRRVRDDSGCYILTRKVTLRDATKRVTCRVHQPEINLTRTTEILIPACLRVTPDRSQFSRYDLISLSCEDTLDNSTGWKVKRNTSAGGVRHCSSSWGSLSSDATCIIGNAYSPDSGVYWCESEDGERSNAVNITISELTVILESPALPVSEGTSVTLHCKAVMKLSDRKFTFYKDGHVIASSSTGEMTIHSASKSDEGLYKCAISGEEESMESWLAVEAQMVAERRGSNDVIMEIIA